MSNLKQWREALDQQESTGHQQYFHSEMMDLLQAGERVLEVVRIAARLEGLSAKARSKEGDALDLLPEMMSTRGDLRAALKKAGYG